MEGTIAKNTAIILYRFVNAHGSWMGNEPVHHPNGVTCPCLQSFCVCLLVWKERTGDI